MNLSTWAFCYLKQNFGIPWLNDSYMFRKFLVLFLVLSSNLNYLIASATEFYKNNDNNIIFNSPTGVNESFDDTLNYFTHEPRDTPDGSPLIYDNTKEYENEISDEIVFISDTVAPSSEVENTTVVRKEDGMKDSVENNVILVSSDEENEDFCYNFYHCNFIDEHIFDNATFSESNDLLRNNQYLSAYEAALKSDINTLRRIADDNISFETFDIETGETPLHAACRSGNLKVISFILSKIKNWNPRDKSGRTPFAVAVASGRKNVFLCMLRTKTLFDLSTPDYEGRSPIMLAALNGHEYIFSMLNAMSCDILHRDTSGRSLLSLLPKTDSIHIRIMDYLKSRVEFNKENVIRRIAPELGFIYRNENIGGSEFVLSILSELEISISQMISAPQAQSANLLIAILDNKEYELYRSLAHDTAILFNINDTEMSAKYDQFSFFNRCLQVASMETIDYLFKNEKPVVDIRSYKAIFEADRVKALKAIEKQAKHFYLYVNNNSLLVPAGLAMANKCFKYLGKKFARDNFLHLQGSNIFREAIIDISEAATSSDCIINLFNEFPNAMETCSTSDLINIAKNCERFDYDDFSAIITVLNEFYRA